MMNSSATVSAELGLSLSEADVAAHLPEDRRVTGLDLVVHDELLAHL